ncbi:MAG: MBL fold metallo-hydrolase, partial [Chloroflexi bacterium]|nr:MBL fold metallo-hydrolase [Chloroflexota bacterium]
MEVASGIYQIRLPIQNNPMGNLNAYLLKDTNGYVMIDSGWPTEITHHLGLAGKIREMVGTKIIMHELESPSISPIRWEMDEVVWNWLIINDLPDTHIAELRKRTWGQGYDFVWRVDPDEMVHGGEKLTIGHTEFEILLTPGHSVGHLCLYDVKGKVLIAGDHVLPVITPNISLWPRSGANPLRAYLNSMNNIKNLDVKIVLPGHQEVFTDFRGRVKDIIKHHKDRINELMTVLGNQEKTAHKI